MTITNKDLITTGCVKVKFMLLKHGVDEMHSVKVKVKVLYLPFVPSSPGTLVFL